eukprot:gene9643-biopygen3137
MKVGWRCDPQTAITKSHISKPHCTADWQITPAASAGEYPARSAAAASRNGNGTPHFKWVPRAVDMTTKHKHPEGCKGTTARG